MHLAALQFRSFRNYERFSGEFSADVQVIVGDNAQGKTSLLEAIHVLSTLRSFRGSSSRELVRFGEPAAAVEGTIAGANGTDRLSVRLGAQEREACVNGKKPAAVADYLRLFPTVRFTPDDLQLHKGESGPRRQALDRGVFGLLPNHFRNLLDYNRALKQKNALLKEARGAWSGSRRDVDDHLAVWNAKLAAAGRPVVAARREFVARVGPLLEAFFREISGSTRLASLSYRGTAATEPELLAAMEARRDEELARGHTVVGPHRDDVVAEIDGRSVRRYASQGQHRMFALALKVAEIELHRRELGRYPVLLLDDVKSELDQDRVRYLFGFLNRIPAQIFVTTTDVRELKDDLARAHVTWRVAAGVATRE